MMKTRFVFVICFLCSVLGSHAQFGNLIQKGLQKGEQLAKKKSIQGADAARDKLDSTDFNYAISVIDNSGIMNIRDFDEVMVKGAYQATNILWNNNNNKTPAQKCRDILDAAEKFYELRQFKSAEIYFLDAKLNYEKDNLTKNINYSKVLADMGLLYSTMGRFNSAELYIADALDIRSQTLGEKSIAYASSVNNRAVLYQETARYNEAEADFAKASDLTKTIIGENSQEHAIVLNNQAILLAKIGRLDDAIANLNKAIAILDSQHKKNIRNQVGFQSNLALLYQQTGKLTEAENIYLKLEKVLGNSNPYYAGVLNSLGLLYIQMNKPEQVEDLLKKSATVYKTRFGEQNPNYAKVTNDLGNFYRRQGRFDEAETALQSALSIRENVLGMSHPDYVSSQEDIGILYWKKGDFEKAYPFFTRAMGKSLDFVNKYFPPMSEAEKSKYWDILFPRFQRFYNYAIDANAKKPELSRDLYDYQIATKALLLSSTNKIKNAILNSKDEALIKDYTSWLDQKETLARLYAYSKEDLNQQHVNLDSMERAANAMEKSLSQRSKDFSQGYSSEKISYKQIGSLLTDQEAAVEIIRVRTFDKDFTNDARYVVLSLTKNSETPKLAVLDNGNQLETRYAKFYKNAITQKSADEYSYNQFWERLDPLVAGKKTLYISPDGVYNQINVSTLKGKDGNFVLTRFDVVIVGNTKDLMTYKNRKTTTQKKVAFLLGFPDYGGDAVAALPGTKVELDGLNKILKGAGYQVTEYMQHEASEKNLKAVKGPGLMHIATHGYFLADADVQGGGAIGVSAENAKNNPLLRSGLLLAGASGTMTGQTMPNLESNDNGVLTAYEAMNLNLEGTDLIILSACETGLGDVKAGEGVYGLQRAFQVAGASALIMSLWKVDDAATQQLMTSFYSNFVKGGDKLKAFKQAQLQLMTKYKEPYYWGAFVMMGE
jgi:CHAT domain-containing protein/Tfp pilus assembly protein PilF